MMTSDDDNNTRFHRVESNINILPCVNIRTEFEVRERDGRLTQVRRPRGKPRRVFLVSFPGEYFWLESTGIPMMVVSERGPWPELRGNVTFNRLWLVGVEEAGARQAAPETLATADYCMGPKERPSAPLPLSTMEHVQYVGCTNLTKEGIKQLGNELRNRWGDEMTLEWSSQHFALRLALCILTKPSKASTRLLKDLELELWKEIDRAAGIILKRKLFLAEAGAVVASPFTAGLSLLCGVIAGGIFGASSANAGREDFIKARNQAARLEEVFTRLRDLHVEVEPGCSTEEIIDPDDVENGNDSIAESSESEG